MSLRLGAFQVGEEIGRGGMARVYAGLHERLGTEVAIKIMAGPARESTEVRSRRFAKEIEAVARLQHPGVVMIYDHGIIDAETAALHPKLQRGIPWFAMEYCSGGNLATHQFENWVDLRNALVTLLDALAYTHAFGVLHRDLKPANVLISDADDVRHGIKLADFGLALGEEDEVTAVHSSLGTPHYMAPEQVLGHWRDFDASTDLYAFGCMVWRLVTGRPPFAHGDAGLTQILTSQLRDTPPRFFPLFAVPDTLEGWLRRLLQKAPLQRFRSAADALAALPDEDAPMAPFDDLQESVNITAFENTVVLPDDATVVVEQTFNDPGFMTWDEDALSQDGVVRRNDQSLVTTTTDIDKLIPARSAPIPTSWRRRTSRASEERLLGAGLALFGLRPTPLVGRHDEQEYLWQTLSEVHRSSGLKAVLLQGEAGCGKSRLSEWLCRQAGWAGAARPLVVTHSDGQAPGQGLSGMIDYHLRCHGQDSKELSKRLAKLCEAWGVEGDFEPRALARIVRPNQEEGTVRFNNPQERYAVIRRLLRRITSDRPLILVIDDIQWGSDALFFVEELLNLGEDLPVLILLTARTRALRERPFIESRLQRLAEGSYLETLELDPLTETDTRELITELIGLSHDLVQQVAMRSEGNPLFAVQLLSDWVARGVLEASDRGFQLAEGEMGRVPDDVHQLWLQRLAELEKGIGQGSTGALELAAVLGRDVVDGEWVELCRASNSPYPERLTDRLFKAGLALPTESGWSFCHALFQESLERQAKEAGRWQQYHQTAAQVLEKYLEPDAPNRARRLGTHLLQARDHAGAVTYLWQAAELHLKASEWVVFEEILDLVDPALDALQLPNDHPWRWDQAKYRFQLADRRFQIEDVMTEVERLIAWAERLEDNERIASIAALAAKIAGDSGDLDAAHRLLAKVRERSLPGTRIRAYAAAIEARIHKTRGDLYRAEEAAADSIQQETILDNLARVAANQQTLADIWLAQGRIQEALDLLGQAIEIADRQGLVSAKAMMVNSRGEVFRADGRLNEALAAYEEARDLALQLEHTYSVAMTSCNVGLVLLAMEQIDAAAPYLEEADRMFRRGGKLLFALVSQAGLLACSALEEDSETVLTNFEEIQASIQQRGVVEMDLAMCLQLTGRIMARREFYGVAAIILTAALQQWDRLGLADHRDRCRRDLESAGVTVER
ncbi:MAG: protein kinase [Myxococcota bacterium]|nr:protein kinase [Myxococcota bacterium]